MKSHPSPRATLNSLSETFAAIVSDPSRPVHLVQTAETETRCTSEPSQERRRLCQFSPVSVQMVQNLLQNIDSRKATGADGIPGLLLKKCAPNLAPSLTAIFIASLAAGELPQAFKQADITPVYKSGDRETASNYRPISLLPIVSKLLEKIVSTQLKAFLASNSLLPEIQFAYRANHSTEDALAFIVNRLLLERDCGKATGLVFVDLSKAFDRVKHQALIDLLSGIGICDTVLKWFANYLSDRQQRVRVGNRFSSQSACSRGVPQGSVLGPLLFTLYVRDLPSCVDVKVLMFADDILLFFSGFSIPEIACRLTNAVTSLDSWLTTRGLQMNIGKTQAMFVLPRGLNIPPDTVVMCNSRPLQLVTSLQVSWCVFRQSPQLGGSDLAHHQESLAKDWGLVTRWSATDVTCKTIILHGHHCCRYWIWFERLLFVSFHLIEGKAYSPLQAWCPSNFQSSTVDAISSPLPATSNLPPSSANGL